MSSYSSGSTIRLEMHDLISEFGYENEPDYIQLEELQNSDSTFIKQPEVSDSSKRIALELNNIKINNMLVSSSGCIDDIQIKFTTKKNNIERGIKDKCYRDYSFASK